MREMSSLLAALRYSVRRHAAPPRAAPAAGAGALAKSGACPCPTTLSWALPRRQTFECAEAIMEWRRTLCQPQAFLWKGMNYLLKVSTALSDYTTSKNGVQ